MQKLCNKAIFKSVVISCGGVGNIADYFKITQWSVRKWEKGGIPWRRCDGLIKLSNGKLTRSYLRPDIWN